MQDIQWFLFIAASLAVIATPGQDMILVLSRSLAEGIAAGVATAAGVSVGLLGHTVVVTMGLGAVLQASETLFWWLKMVGAAYLVYLGVQLLRSSATDLALQQGPGQSLQRLFWNGALSNISNPKIIVFYLAFLPQFVPASHPQPAAALFALGVTFAGLTFLVKAPVGYFAGRLSAWFQARPSALSWLYRTSGMVLLGLGLKLAFATKS
jgi:threonine/homoserine/homoserine lactone efflux protein